MPISHAASMMSRACSWDSPRPKKAGAEPTPPKPPHPSPIREMATPVLPSIRYCITREGSRSETCRPLEHARLAVVANDVLPLTGVGACHDGDDGLGGADVEHFVRYSRFDEDEIPGGILDSERQTRAVLMAHATGQ